MRNLILGMLFCFMLGSAFAAGTTVYMKQEENGTITFSDSPASGSEPIKLDPSTLSTKTSSAPNSSNNTENQEPADSGPGALPPVGTPEADDATPGAPAPNSLALPKQPVQIYPYLALKISGITDQETLQNPTAINVSGNLTYGESLDAAKTGLQEGDKIVLFMDGTSMGSSTTSTSFSLDRDKVPRGQHVFQLVVMDGANSPKIKSDRITVFVHYHSVNSPAASLEKQLLLTHPQFQLF